MTFRRLIMKNRSSRIWVSTIVVLAVSIPLAAGAKLAGALATEVSFTAVGPAGLKIVGSGNDLKVNDDGSTVKVTVPLRGMKTGISLRDQHMHEKYLETA